MQMSSSIANLAPALLKAQRNMGDAVKGASNPFFKSRFADLNAVREAVIPAMNAEGISVWQPTVTLDGKNYVRTLLLHTSGEFLSSDTEIISAKPNDPQAHGSGLSYARRYGLQAIANIGAVDDDAELSMNRATPVLSKPLVVAAKPVEAAPAVAAPAQGATSEDVPAKKSAFKRPNAAKPVEAPKPAASSSSEWE